MRIALLIKLSPAVLSGINDDRIDPVGRAALEREVVFPRRPTIMRRSPEIR